ncbi:hypothetical protein E2C01_019310 [Portunus trituberculatus]|uniref:Uncharacterized protein n=1 Tax=Portunus trituberculatus TaxID=210409 RepID=A0A5B7DYU4_PORTR|nr:hypothetical protein [Portunus trituberculatus]
MFEPFNVQMCRVAQWQRWQVGVGGWPIAEKQEEHEQEEDEEEKGCGEKDQCVMSSVRCHAIHSSVKSIGLNSSQTGPRHNHHIFDKSHYFSLPASVT